MHRSGLSNVQNSQKFQSYPKLQCAYYQEIHLQVLEKTKTVVQFAPDYGRDYYDAIADTAEIPERARERDGNATMCIPYTPARAGQNSPRSEHGIGMI